MMLCFTLTVICNTPIFADSNPDGFGDPSGDDVPVDGGLSLFIAAGVGYGIKKAKDLKNRKIETEEKSSSSDK
jgi:hypothetical protein